MVSFQPYVHLECGWKSPKRGTLFFRGTLILCANTSMTCRTYMSIFGTTSHISSTRAPCKSTGIVAIGVAFKSSLASRKKEFLMLICISKRHWWCFSSQNKQPIEKEYFSSRIHYLFIFRSQTFEHITGSEEDKIIESLFLSLVYHMELAYAPDHLVFQHLPGPPTLHQPLLAGVCDKDHILSISTKNRKILHHCWETRHQRQVSLIIHWTPSM